MYLLVNNGNTASLVGATAIVVLIWALLSIVSHKQWYYSTADVLHYNSFIRELRLQFCSSFNTEYWLNFWNGR